MSSAVTSDDAKSILSPGGSGHLSLSIAPIPSPSPPPDAATRSMYPELPSPMFNVRDDNSIVANVATAPLQGVEEEVDESRVSIIGYTGLIGGILRNAYGDRVQYKYNTKNIDDITSVEHDIVMCAAPSATKWWANLHPEEDLASINKLIASITSVKCNKFILFSTVDVYSSLDGGNENTDPQSSSNHAYGRHRFHFEQTLKKIFGDKLSIIRLCGLFGFGLKKNIIYDFIYDKLTVLNPDSMFQWYPLTLLHQDVEYVLQHNIKLINLFVEPVDNTELLSVLREYKYITPKLDSANPVRYNVQTIHALPSRYWLDKATVLASLRLYLNSMLNSPIIISNLCWTASSPMKTDTIHKYGIRRLEVAPHRHFGEGFIEKPLSFFDQYKNDHIYSFQALYFPKTFTIDKDYDEVLEYTKKIIHIAHFLNVKVLVFGAPKLRFAPLPEGKTASDPLESVTNTNPVFRAKMVRFFRAVGDYLAGHAPDTKMCIEPNARKYGANFVINSFEARDFILEVDRPQIRLVLDTGCMTLENESIESAFEHNFDILGHVHFSVPELKSLFLFKHNPQLKFPYLLRRLASWHYGGAINIEMLNQTDDDVDRTLYELTKPPSVAIVGAGWYGCHLFKTLTESGIRAAMYEKGGIFGGSSKYNQNRLHLGFHYVRSFETRRMCRDNFDHFMRQYGFCTQDIPQNIYIVAKSSLVDFHTFVQIMQSTRIDFDILSLTSDATDVKDPGNMFETGLRTMGSSSYLKQAAKAVIAENCQGTVRCKERFIDPARIKRHYEAVLGRFVNTEEIRQDKMAKLQSQYDVVFDCTNNQLGRINSFKDHGLFYEITLSCVYKRLQAGPVVAFTVMDGEFPSLFPFDIAHNLYSLTHVKYTPLFKTKSLDELRAYTVDEQKVAVHRAAMEADIRLFVHDFDQHFKYQHYFTSVKVKGTFSSDSRECLYSQDQNVLSLSCGKITGIFEAERLLSTLLALQP